MSARSSTVTPVYPTWIRSSRIVLFWSLAAGTVAVAVVVGLLHPLGFTIALAAAPFSYIALVVSWVSHRLEPGGDDVQNRIHQLLVDSLDSLGGEGRLLDIGCGSGQLLIRFAKSAPGEHVGLDHWGTDWDYSQALAERNAELEGISGLRFTRGTASHLPFPDAHFARVLSCLAFHEVQDATDKTVGLGEALRVLEPGGSFAFVDLFDARKLFGGRDRALEVIVSNGGQVSRSQRLSELIELRFPLNLAQALKPAVLVTGIKGADGRHGNGDGAVELHDRRGAIRPSAS